MATPTTPNTRPSGLPASRAAVYVDPAPAVCAAAVCKAVVDGVITYRDDNHLTAAFSASIRHRLAQVLSTPGRSAV